MVDRSASYQVPYFDRPGSNRSPQRDCEVRPVRSRLHTQNETWEYTASFPVLSREPFLPWQASMKFPSWIQNGQNNVSTSDSWYIHQNNVGVLPDYVMSRVCLRYIRDIGAQNSKPLLHFRCMNREKTKKYGQTVELHAGGHLYP